MDYIVQTGDNLPALAVHFNTSVQEIRSANPIIPDDATTLPPGMPMKIPIYYESLMGQLFSDHSRLSFYQRSGPGWL